MIEETEETEIETVIAKDKKVTAEAEAKVTTEKRNHQETKVTIAIDLISCLIPTITYR